jgi:hypothetical protein
LKRLPGSVIHDLLAPEQQAASVVVALVDAARHVELQAAVAQVAARSIGEVKQVELFTLNPLKY